MKRALLAATLALAGCLGVSPPGPGVTQATDYGAIEAAIGAPIVPDHDHADASLHVGAFNLERVALARGAGEAPAGEAYAETAVKGGFAYLSRYGPEAGLAIFDASAIESPAFVGEIRLNAGFEPDIEVSDDGRWAFWETQRFPLSAETPSPEPGANLPRGVHIVDITDKANPRWAGFSPTTPDGPHSITYANLSGRHILFQSVYAMAYAYGNVEVPGQQRLVISELDASGPVATLVTLAEYVHPDAAGGPGLFPHDVSVAKHPITGRDLAFVAYWDVGVVILDVTEPERPTLVSTFADFGPDDSREMHMARIFPETIDGKVVLVCEPEIGGGPDTGYVTFADVTDPADPKYLSSWLLPGNLTGQANLGPHYFDARFGRVALASYHAGVWIIDVSTRENLLRPRSVAFAEIAPAPAGLPVGGLGNGSAFDAWWADEEHVVVGDTGAGLAVYRYTGPRTAASP